MEESIERLQNNSLTSWPVKGVIFAEFSKSLAHRFLSALEQNESLQELKLQGAVYEHNIFNEKTNCERLLNALGKLPALKSLEISTGFFLDIDFIAAVMGFEGLERLILTDCIRISSLDTVRLFQTALQDHPSLRTIELHNIYMIGYAPARDQEIPRLDYLLNAFASIANLESVVLSCTPGTLYAYQGPLHSARCMASFIGKTTLKSFQADNLRITDKDMECMARNIRPRLESLRLSSYYPEDTEEDHSGFQQLLNQVLGQASPVKVLTIEGLPQKAASRKTNWEKMVISMLEKNLTIVEFKIPGLSRETRTTADMYLRLNHAGRRELLHRPNVQTNALANVLFALRQCPDSLFYILTSTPWTLFR
jgi:hypothetical protein